jgi:hypothetical protein
LAIGEGRKKLKNYLMSKWNWEILLRQRVIECLKDMNDYDYLIRLAKWNDHKGDLKTAITMEKPETLQKGR